LIQVWINKDNAANAAAFAAKLNALVKERSGGRNLRDAEILDLLRGIVIFIDDGRKAEAVALCEKNRIEHCGVAYLPAKGLEDALDGYAIPADSKNVIFVSYDETIKAVFADLSPKEFDKVVKAYEAAIKKK
jgi:hypothetical protein